MLEWLGFALLGIIGGCASGLLGIGGAIIIIPVLVYVFGFGQKLAQGTTLFLMVFPIGIMALIEYYKAGLVNIKAGLIIAAFFVVGSLIGAKIALNLEVIDFVHFRCEHEQPWILAGKIFLHDF